MQCSIDSLLERTIKHMVFMQSVTKHADKLSNSVKSKVRIECRCFHRILITELDSHVLGYVGLY